MSMPTPSEFKAVVVLPSDNLCTRFLKTFIRFPILWYKWKKWAFKADGTLSDDFAQKICAACN